MLKLRVLSCCLPRNLGEWPFQPLLYRTTLSHFIVDTLTSLGNFTAAPTLTCRFLEGEDGEDTAKISQADIAEAVDIASAAKVSLRMAEGPGKKAGGAKRGLLMRANYCHFLTLF